MGCLPLLQLVAWELLVLPTRLDIRCSAGGVAQRLANVFGSNIGWALSIGS